MLLKVIECNVHGLNSNSCPDYIASEIKRQDADIAILTEYVENANYDGAFENLIKESYHLFRQPKPVKGNGVLIAVKKSEDIQLDCRSRFYSIPAKENKSDYPEFLHAFIKYKDVPITIIGLRVRTAKDYKLRCKQVDSILQYIKNLDNKYQHKIIVAGDFNNSRIIGEENEYDHRGQYAGLDTQHYNLQLIKSKFKESGFFVFNSTPKGSVFNTYSQVFGSYTYKQDHIFVKGLNISDTQYDWSYKEQNYIRDGGRNPDHAILKANIEV